MEESQIIYNLKSKTGEFIKEAGRKGFFLRNLSSDRENLEYYEVVKKLISTQNTNNFEILAHIIEGRLVIHSFPLYNLAEAPLRNHSVKQLEKLAKNFGR